MKVLPEPCQERPTAICGISEGHLPAFRVPQGSFDYTSRFFPLVYPKSGQNKKQKEIIDENP